MRLIVRNMHRFRVRCSFLAVITLMVFLISSEYVSGQGIQFTGGNRPIEQRTSADFFPKNATQFRGHFTLTFDLQLPNDDSGGYIVRIQEKQQRPIFNLYYNEEDDHALFLLNEEGKTSLISARIPLQHLKDRHWFPVRVMFDLQKGQVALQIADQPEQTAPASLQSPYAPRVTFGRSDYMIDVPSFSLRNFQIGNLEKKIIFPLRESAGNKLHNASGEVMGKVTNGTWLLNHAYHWQKHVSMYSSSPAASEYDPKRKSIYYINGDSLQIYQVQTGQKRSIRFQTPCPMKFKLGNSFIDPQEDRLYVYETFYVTPYEGPTVASLDLQNFTWRAESDDYPHRELNHHASHFLPDYRKLLVFGGFGNTVYSNDLRFYDLKSKRWSMPTGLRGDPILPRYFTSIGRSGIDGKLYIFGGMGNESGQHIVGRQYFYDLYTIDPETGHSKKLWDLQWEENLFVPARGLVIPDTTWLYMLGYPEHLTHSHIKLRRFSIRDGKHEELGDSIPIYSDRISTRARLYFDAHLGKLIALVQESDDDVRSKLTIYSLDFPAINEAQLHAFPTKRGRTVLPYVAAVIALCVGSLLYTRYRGRYKTRTLPVSPLSVEPDGTEALQPATAPHINRIYLFGDFTVVDKQGMDISHLFSTRLQQVFCLILFQSDAAGISSNLLSHLLWPDKPKDKVKASRGVAINSLRKVLSELDGIEIIYEDGHYRAVVGSACYCDYQYLKEQLAAGMDILSDEILAVLERGEFLLGMDDPIFDKIKNRTESMLIGAFQESMAQSREQKNWIRLFRAATMLLAVDPANEPALENGLYALARGHMEQRPTDFYKRFSDNYCRLMGEEYNRSFEEVWRQASR